MNAYKVLRPDGSGVFTAFRWPLPADGPGEWIRSDPDGYLNIYARDASYFDPFAQKRVDGLDELTAQVAPIRNMKPPFTDIRYEMVNPRVQVSGVRHLVRQ